MNVMNIESAFRPSGHRQQGQAGFSLVELLVVIAIIGLLVSILLPAVQSAREAARRTICLFNARGVTQAALVYESRKGLLPVGSHNAHWLTWLPQILPFMEEAAFDNNYDRRLYLLESRFNAGQNVLLTQILFPALACPSDGVGSPVRTTMENNPSAHSYVACTGNGVYVASRRGWMSRLPPGVPGVAVPGPGFGNGMFRWQGGAFVMSGADENLVPPEDQLDFRRAMAVRLAEVTDGCSKTLAFSEVIRRPKQGGGLSADYRGLSWWGPGSLFSTILPPNAAHPDTLPSKDDCGPEGLDVSPPCWTPHAISLPVVLAARSRHPGGVVASRLDSSVRFYDEGIDPDTWEALGTTKGGEAIIGIDN